MTTTATITACDEIAQHAPALSAESFAALAQRFEQAYQEIKDSRSEETVGRVCFDMTALLKQQIVTAKTQLATAASKDALHAWARDLRVSRRANASKTALIDLIVPVVRQTVGSDAQEALHRIKGVQSNLSYRRVQRESVHNFFTSIAKAEDGPVSYSHFGNVPLDEASDTVVRLAAKYYAVLIGAPITVGEGYPSWISPDAHDYGEYADNHVGALAVILRNALANLLGHESIRSRNSARQRRLSDLERDTGELCAHRWLVSLIGGVLLPEEYAERLHFPGEHVRYTH